MKWIFIGLAYLLATPVMAQSIFKCRDGQGQVVYQSEQCPGAEKRWDTEPRQYTWDDYYKRQAADRKIESDRRNLRARASETSQIGSTFSGANIEPQGGSSCARAKQARDAAYAQMGSKRSFQASRNWDDYVWKNCK